MQTTFALSGKEDGDGDGGHAFRLMAGRRKSLAPESSLPPIMENESGSRKPLISRKSLQNLRSPSLSKSPTEAMSPTYRRESLAGRRESLSYRKTSIGDSRRDSNSSTGSYRDAGRRESFMKMGSNPGGVFPPLGKLKRSSFGTIGRKVATLLRARNAFSKIKHRDEIVADDPEESDYEIKELPKAPRFASTLSPEAQYAMMKGYEDVVYSSLINSHPEYRPLLKRNKTPCGVKVREVTDTRRIFEPPMTSSTPKPEEAILKDEKDGPAEAFSNEDENRSQTSKEIEKEEQKIPVTPITPKRKTKTQVPLIDRQLVMTYRYQSAMDILDGIRRSQGLHSLSPRVSSKSGEYVPIKEFNSWAGVWNREFEKKQKARHVKV